MAWLRSCSNARAKLGGSGWCCVAEQVHDTVNLRRLAAVPGDAKGLRKVDLFAAPNHTPNHTRIIPRIIPLVAPVGRWPIWQASQYISACPTLRALSAQAT